VVDRVALIPAGLVLAAGAAVTVLDPRRGTIVQAIPAGGLVVGLAERDGTLVAATRTRRLFAAGVRVPRAAPPAEKPRAVVSLVVEPRVVQPRKGAGATVTFSLTESRPLVVDVADVRGRRVKLLANRDRAWPDTYRYEWDGRSEDGKPAAPGVYRVRVTAGEEAYSVGIEAVEAW
jgi:hypothetical protein